MTKNQRKLHKIGNQQRKSCLLALLQNANPEDRPAFNILGGFQNGKNTLS